MNEGKNSFYKEAEEKGLLASILVDLDVYRSLRPSLNEDLFFSQKAKQVWSAIRELEVMHKEPTLVLVNDLLEEKDSDIFIADWALDLSVRDSPFDLLSILQKHSQKRKMIDFRYDLDSVISSTELDTDSLMGKLSTSYMKLVNDTNSTTEMEYANETVSRLYDLIASENGLRGLSTGFKCIDERVLGMKPGDLFVIGAQTSIGKTALALNITRNVAMDGHEVAFFSLEMRPEKLYLRIAATIMGVPANIIGNTQHWDSRVSNNIGAVFDRIAKFPIRMPPCEKFSIDKIVSVARQSHHKKPLKLIVIDYLQIINDPRSGENRASFISNVCSELKALAMSLGIPIIVLAQVNRSTNKGNVHKPELWHLKESGSIEQAADVVLLIHRNKYKEGSEGYDAELGNSLAMFRIVKNREGECSDILVSYDPEITQFSELSEEELRKIKS